MEDRSRWSVAVCGHLAGLVSSQRFLDGFLGAFSPMSIEPDITGLIDGLLGERDVCFPRMNLAVGAGVMDFFRVAHPDEMVLEPRFGGRWKEPSPGSEAVVPEALSLILVPFVAIDDSGTRLGRGGGYYDRYLACLRPEVLKVAVGFEIQRVRALPFESHDVRMDMLVTERGVERF